jgi:hypothetical protein
MRKSAAALLSVGSFLVWAVPANADDQFAAGCQAYGHDLAVAARLYVPFGQILTYVASRGPGAVAAFSESLRSLACGS